MSSENGKSYLKPLYYICCLCKKQISSKTATLFKERACCPDCEPRFVREIVIPETDATPGNARRKPLEMFPYKYMDPRRNKVI